MIQEYIKELEIEVIYENKEYAVDFTCYEVTGTDSEGKRIYQPLNGNGGDFTDDISKAEVFFKGYIKWDGCSHVFFGDEQGYLHLCGKFSIKQLSDALKLVYNRCGELMVGHQDLSEFPLK